MGTKPLDETESLLWQGIELFPYTRMWSGYKVGTMGTEDQILKLFPPVPKRSVKLWVQTKPVM
ncbi:MAG: hypothetical protein ACRDC6_19830, partial [Shewanella sp.]